MNTEREEKRARLAEALARIASRKNKFYARKPDLVDVASVRVRMGMSQEQFDR